MNSESLTTALKDWHAVCRALESGRQTVLLRKGGIHEAAGEFEIDHRQFLMFPTWLHQKLDWIKEPDRDSFEARSAEPEQIELRVAAEVTDIVLVRTRAQMDAIGDAHIYLPPLIDMRFNYRPENPLYLLIVRAWKLPTPEKTANTLAYAGCKSWVPLDAPVSLAGATPAIADDAFALLRQRLLRLLAI